MAALEIALREMRPEEYGQLREFTYGSLFVPPGEAPFPRKILEKPEVKHYYEGFGSGPADHCHVAESGGQLVGAAWSRLLAGAVPGYGNLDTETPEIGLAVKEGFRNRGIGTALMEALAEKLRQEGYARMSLSVQKANRAHRLYRRLGFRVEKNRETDYLMVLDL